VVQLGALDSGLETNDLSVCLHRASGGCSLECNKKP
jgi:hypothetical protein